MSTFINSSTGNNSSSAPLVRGSGALQGWTSYTAPTAATGTFAMIEMSMDGITNYEFSVQIDSGTTQTYSFNNFGDPGDGSVYLGSSSGFLESDAQNLANGIAATFDIATTTDGSGNFTITSGTTGSGSRITISGPPGFTGGDISGTAAIGPIGQVTSITLLAATSGKTSRIIDVYASGSGNGSWVGTLALAYGDGTPIYSAVLSGNTGAIPFPFTAVPLHIDNLNSGVLGQSITATFTSNDLSNFGGGTLEILVICDQQ